MRRHFLAAAFAAVVFSTAACRPQAGVAADAGDTGGAGATAPSTAATTAAIGPSDGQASETSRRAAGDPVAAADRALRESRLYAPAGDNAFEYWLDARARSPGDAVAASAIVELQPYLLIGCEQAIARHDFAEARRLHGLLARGDPGAPALARLAEAIIAAEAVSGREDSARLAALEADRQRADAEARAGERARAAAEQIAAARREVAGANGRAEASPRAVTPPVRQSSAPSPAPAPAATPAAAARIPAPDSRVDATTSTAAAPPSPPRPLHQPPPRYPSLALARGMQGAVEVAFTIQPDGSVAEARILEADPPGVFDRSALAAVGSYRFEASGRRVPSRITVRFSLNQ